MEIQRFVHTRDVSLAISLSDAISLESLLSFQIATAGDNDKQVMFSRLCKHHLMDHLHWRSLLAKLLATTTRSSQVTGTSVLALATLGGTTKIEVIVFLVKPPRWPRQVISDCRVS
jgi:hypothetical protein